MDYEHTVIETRLLMELVSAKTALDAIMAVLQSKKSMYTGLSNGELETIIDLFGKEKESNA
jgi:hypothetical protein